MLIERIKRIKEDVRILLVMTLMPIVITYFFINGHNDSKIAIVQGKTNIKFEEIDYINMKKDEAMKALNEGRVQGVLIIGERSNLIFKENTLIKESLKREVLKQLKKESVLKYINDSSKQQMNSLPPLPVAIDIREKPFDSEQEKLKTLLGFMIFFAMYPVSYSITNVLREKREGTWQRQLVAPIEKWQLIGVNLVYSVILGLIQLYTVLLVSKFIFHVNFTGSYSLIFLLFTLFAITVASLSLMLTTIIKNENQLGNALPIITTASAMLAGCFWPFELVSNKLLRLLGYLMPQRWVLDAIYKVGIRDGNIISILPNIIILAIMSLIFFKISIVREKI